MNQAIAALTPKVTGTGLSYSVSPALPAGLSLNSTSGALSGTPSVAAPASAYTITATNAAGNTTAGLLIAITSAASGNIYPSPYYAFTVGEGGVAYAAAKPTLYGGFPVGGQASLTWTVSPALPSGLKLGATDGGITGIPTAAAPAAAYTVTATSSGGAYSTTLTLAVSPGPAFDLGHSANVDLFGFNGKQLLSRDSNEQWKLWDNATGSVIASGLSTCPWEQGSTCSILGSISLAGPTVMIGTTDGFELRAAADGHVLSTVKFARPGAVFWFKLAQDGSYVVAGTNTEVTVWSTAGNVLVTHSGDYSHAIGFAAPGAVEVGLGPAGQHVVELISVATGTSTVSPQFPGEFAAWFEDGTRFVAAALPSVSVYSAAGALLGQMTVPQVPELYGGYGNWLWTYGARTMTVYPVGNGSVAAGSYSGDSLIASGSTVALLNLAPPANLLEVVDLSGAAPSGASYTLPVGNLGSYVASSAAAWLVGTENGVLVDGAGLPAPPRFLTYGDALAVAGSSERFAVATASGRIVYFSASTLALEGSINLLSSSLLLSSDGTVLAAAVDGQDSVNVYSLPGGTLVNSISGGLLDMALAGAAPVLAIALSGNPNCDTELVPALGGAAIWCQTFGSYQRLRLSPDSTHIAVAQVPTVAGTTSIYEDTQFVRSSVVPGWGVGWLDNNQLLVNYYVDGTGRNAGILVFDNSNIYDAAGAFVSLPPLPEIDNFQLRSAGTIYDIGRNIIASASTGATVWASGSPRGSFNASLGASAGGYIIFNGRYSTILAEPTP